MEIVTDQPDRKENIYKGTIIHRAYLGNFLYFFAKVGDTQIRVQASHNVSLEEGADIDLFLDPEKCMLLS